MAETFKPTEAIANNAKRALKWLEEGYAGSGFTDVGRKRASQLANRQPVSEETVKRMYSYLSRHEVDKKGKDFDNLQKPSAGRVAWDAWGGDAGKTWSASIVARLEKEKEKSMANKAVDVADTFAYAPIMKYEERTDGSLLVYGKATDDTLDSDEQVCDPAWLDRAMPAWFKFGNVREQHSNIAAGVAVEYEKLNESEHYITVNVVDKNSKEKVKAGVLKGFSIGIRRPRVVKDNKAIGGRIVDGEIVEVSLVDRPANPACVLTVAKSIGSANLVQVEEFAKGETMSAELETESVVVAVPTDPNTFDLTDSENDSAQTALTIIGRAKAIAGDDLHKFDAGIYRNARSALAQLIAVESKELEEGHDERMSLSYLLNAVHNLLSWYEGEEAEGEVTPAEDVELEAEAIEMSVKCLECGCHQPADSHGRSDVTVAVISEEKADETMLEEEEAKADETMPAEEEEKLCKECGKAEADCECETELAIAGDTNKNDDIKELVTSLVKTILKGESQTKSADSEERIKALETELEQVKSLATSGGPKRIGAVNRTSEVDEKMQLVHELQLKASSTLDAKLAEGYRLKANDLIKSISK